MKLGIKTSSFTSIWLVLLLLGSVFGLFSGCGYEHGADGQAKEEQLYTCGMHPQVVQPKPGNCPICGMKLTPIRKQGTGEDKAAAAGAQVIAVDPATTQNMGIRTARITRGPLRRLIRTVGTIDYNESALADVTTKFRGWVEKLYVDATGQQVHRGEPLFEIYSPELYSAQREYVLALEGGTNAPGSASLRASALTKLKFFDISDEQIAELDRTREPRKTVRVSAPQDGFVVEKAIIQGQLVDAGLRLYRLADLSLVWVQAQIYEQDLTYVHLGQEAIISLAYLADREFSGSVTYIYPNIDEKTRTARVRMEFHNPGYFLKPGMFATVEVAAELDPSAVLVPDMAVLRSGEKNTVFVALDGGKFEPRAVVLGPQGENDNYQVLSGLIEGERIVTSGQFMLDSESQLREAIQKMAGAGTAPVKTREEGGAAGPGTRRRARASAGSSAAGTSDTNVVKYICPMPEHVSIQYDHPGKCSICGMTLVPVSEAVLAKLPPGGKLLYFTCPMPEHSDVQSQKAGKCPKCGMTLIPVMEAPPVTRTNAAAAAAPAIETKAPAHSVTLYTCLMAAHEVVSDQPGKCPKCEMDLVPTSTVSHGATAEANWRKAHPADH
jgi:RND family efflux transporter MFP subunit